MPVLQNNSQYLHTAENNPSQFFAYVMQNNTNKYHRETEMKEMIFVIATVFYLAGLLFLKFKYLKNNNPNSDLIIKLLKQISSTQ